MSKARRIFAAIHDPGGAAGLLPVVAELEKKIDTKIVIFVSKLAEAKAAGLSLPFSPLAADLDFEQATTLLVESGADLLLTGTSWQSRAEQSLRNAAAELGVRSVVFVDYWANYRERLEGAGYAIAQAPDWFCVVDQAMKSEMVKAGFPAQQVLVTKHPGLEKLAAAPRISSPRKNSRKVLFLSEPARSAHSGKLQRHPFLLVAQALAEVDSGSTTLVFRPHPKEVVDRATSKLLAEAGKFLKNIQLGAALILPDEFREHELVVGFQSMGLLEAAASGCRVIALPTVVPSAGLMAAFSRYGVKVATPSIEEIQKILSSGGIAPTQGLDAGACEAVVVAVLAGK